MDDNKLKRGTPDRDLISLKERYEVVYWTGRLGVSEAKLRLAIKIVGHSARAVRAYLANH